MRLALQLGAAVLLHLAAAAEGPLRELLETTARGHVELRRLLGRSGGPRGALLSAADEFGFSALSVAAYNGDWQAAELLLDAGAKLPAGPGELTVFMGESRAQVGSVVELMVRRSSMLIMLGTGFQLPAYLAQVSKRLATSRRPSPNDPEVPDMARTLELLAFRAGAAPTEKSTEEGSDLARAAYFLDSALVEVLVRMEAGKRQEASSSRSSPGTSRALSAAMLGIGQLKHRLNRALLQQPRMAGRMFREYYGFAVDPEETLLDPEFHSMSFEDTLRIVKGKAREVVRILLDSGADPSVPQSKQSSKTPLHQCAEHGLTDLAEALLAAGANMAVRSHPLERTPLHSAVVHRSAGVLRALLAAGADTTAADGSGRSALDLARLLRWVEGQQLLLAVAGPAARRDAWPLLGGESKLLPPLGVLPGEEATGLHELLPQGWQLRWQRGDLVGRSWAPPADADAVGVGRASCEIDVVNGPDLTSEQFLADYLSLRRPLLVRDGANSMPALERWANLKYLVRKAGSTVMSAVTIPYPDDFGDRDAKDARRLTLKDYIENVMGKVNSTSGTPLYVFSVVEQEDPAFKKLLNLIQADASPKPGWLAQDPKSKLQLRFGNIQFGLGPAGSGAPQHYHTHAYASLFSGRKRWLFYPPPASALSRQHAITAAREDALVRQSLRPVAAGEEAAARGKLPLICEQAPGDVVYVPTDWGHMTLNLETSVSVSREFSWDGEETDSHVINSLQL